MPLPVAPTRFLLPPQGFSQALSTWAVIACDQFSTHPDYWRAVTELVGDEPSLLGCMIRDTELSAPDLDQRIDRVIRTMAAYHPKLVPTERGVMLVERWLPGTPTPRFGVVLTVDLEHYDYSHQEALIRPTERTVVARLPTRHRVRAEASLDLSHIVVLIDDPDRKIIEPLFRSARPPTEDEVAYSFPLMQGGGQITGRLLPEGDPKLAAFMKGLAGLVEPERYQSRYHLAEPAEHPLMMVIGDGNHSLAVAKRVWEEKKQAGAAPDHPARYALVELNNIHSHEFQPIHRLIGGTTGARLIEVALKSFAGSAFDRADDNLDFAGLFRQMMKHQEAAMGARSVHRLPIKAADVTGILTIPAPTAKLEVGTVEQLCTALGAGIQVDYVYGGGAEGEGAAELTRLVSEPERVGILLPSLDKSLFFESIIKDGPLPAKAFSIGAAHEKRYYLETRSLRPS